MSLNVQQVHRMTLHFVCRQNVTACGGNLLAHGHNPKPTRTGAAIPAHGIDGLVAAEAQRSGTSRSSLASGSPSRSADLPRTPILQDPTPQYRQNIGDWIVPHVATRPLTLVHCPAGIAAPCNYLKHAKAWGPTALRRVKIQEKTKVGEYLVADTIEAVISLAQMGIVEIHTWNSTADDVDHPNRIVWDLDPGPDVTSEAGG